MSDLSLGSAGGSLGVTSLPSSRGSLYLGTGGGGGRGRRSHGTALGSGTMLPGERDAAWVLTLQRPGLDPALAPPWPWGPSGLCLPDGGSPSQPGPPRSAARPRCGSAFLAGEQEARAPWG